ncbi:uncharacterized protein ACRADG_002079 [Cochliomyia hominivorax]
MSSAIISIFLLMQSLAAQQHKSNNQSVHINQQHVANQGHQIHTNKIPQTQHNSVQQNSQVQQHNTQNVAQHVTQQVASQNVHQPAAENNNQKVNSVKENTTVHHPSTSHKVSVQIPSKVELVVTQVAQHIPNVVGQHVADQSNIQKQRLVRSLVNRLKLVGKPRKCSFECSPSDPQVCAHNGHCYQEFESQCEMSAYNCLNTQKRFHMAHDAECRDSSTVKCYPGDM